MKTFLSGSAVLVMFVGLWFSIQALDKSAVRNHVFVADVDHTVEWHAN